MINTYKAKKILIIILIILIIGAVLLTINFKSVPKASIDPQIVEPIVSNKEPINYCYFRENKVASTGYYDKVWLKIQQNGVNLTGEFHDLPAESDSKVGDFSAKITPIANEKEDATKTNFVWWNSRAEGMETKEELIIKWQANDATVGYGEMVDRGDSVYVYKDKNNLTFIKAIPQIDCTKLDEKLSVEKYIKDNIKIIATNSAVLGGSWHVTTITINEESNIAEISYEDGHIVSYAKVSYVYKNNPDNISITKFELVK